MFVLNEGILIFFRVVPSELEEAVGYVASQLFMTRELFKATTLRDDVAMESIL